MSKDLVRMLQAELAKVRAEKVKVLAQRDSARAALEQFLGGERHRLTYPPGSPRDESGRAIGECKTCHAEKVALVGSSRCRSCYNRLYHRTHPRKHRIGSR